MNEISYKLTAVMKSHTTTSFVPVDKYVHDMHSICGEFELRPSGNKNFVWGSFSAHESAGVQSAQITTNIESAERTSAGIKRDNGENYFLILQRFGRAVMSQNKVSRLLSPGDFVLIDSAKPSSFRFFGERAHQVSIHLPRCEVRERFNVDLSGGTALNRRNSNTCALRSVVDKLSDRNTTLTENSYLKDAMYGLLGLSLFHDIQNGVLANGPESLDSAELSKLLNCLDENYRDPEFSVVKMAEFHGFSVRKMQRVFESSGLTPTSMLISKRMEYARLRIEKRLQCSSSESISSIAHDAGFSDISYFNRCFKKNFDCSPTQYIARRIDGLQDS